MQCNYNLFIQIINFHGLFRNALRCRKTGACRNTGARTVFDSVQGLYNIQAEKHVDRCCGK